ncbi:MAG: molecular chaperone HtpG, partial [Neisseriaceae bacterium]|nr:molecular chaperone HtpG [Neisseriaceae bacterium]
EFEGKALQSVAKGSLDLGELDNEADKAAQAAAETAAKPLLEKIQATLGDKIEMVRPSTRLTDSPACLVVGDNAMSSHLERLLKQAGQDLPSSKPTLEINVDHLLVQRLGQEENSERSAELAQVLYEQALLAEGGKLDDPAAFVKRINRLMLELSN